MAPAVNSTRYVREVHRPSLVAPLGATLEALNSRPRGHGPLMDQPTLEFQHAVHGLAVDPQPLREAQQHPQPPITKGRISLDQRLDALGQCSVDPRWHRSQYRARPQPGAGKPKHSTHSAHRYAGQRPHYSSDVPGVVGRCFAASRRMSRSMVSSPTLRLSRLTSSSRSASSSFGRARSAFSAPSRKRSRHSSTSATLTPCRRAASAAVVSPLSTLITRVARCFAVQRCTSSDCCSSAICHLARSLDLCTIGGSISKGSSIALAKKKPGKEARLCSAFVLTKALEGYWHLTRTDFRGACQLHCLDIENMNIGVR